MSLVTVRLDDKLIGTVVRQAQALHISKTEYVREAIEEKSVKIASQELRESLMQASLEVREESKRINEEFSKIEYDPKF